MEVVGEIIKRHHGHMVVYGRAEGVEDFLDKPFEMEELFIKSGPTTAR